MVFSFSFPKISSDASSIDLAMRRRRMVSRLTATNISVSRSCHMVIPIIVMCLFSWITNAIAPCHSRRLSSSKAAPLGAREKSPTMSHDAAEVEEQEMSHCDNSYSRNALI